jgi:hypothetical protein
VKKFCSDVPKGHGRVRACLEEHLDQLSPECRAHLEQKARSPRRPR